MNTYNFNTLFILQPTVWDVLSSDYEMDKEESKRKSYIKKLYREILLQDNQNVVNLCNLDISEITPEMFIDWQHLNSDGYKKIAQIIKKILTKKFQCE